MSNDILKTLLLMNSVLPNLIRLVEHYKEISDKPDLPVEDKEKAKEILEGLRWKPWDEI